MRIGELAAKAGVNVQTVRFYERKGILEEPPRSRAGYRCYGASDLEALRFVRRSQELGFTLGEISQLLPLHYSIARMPVARTSGGAKMSGAKSPKPRQVREIAAVARCRLGQVEQKLRLLNAMRRQLVTFITRLETDAPTKCLAPKALG